MSTNLFARSIVGPQPDDPFADRAILAAMLRFETALAAAQGRLGIIPAGTAESIARCAATVELDADALAREGAVSGSLAIPFVRALTAHVRAHDEAAAAHVHAGATSQDVLDTALVLCTAEATRRVVASMIAASRATAALARAHAPVPALARTLLQPAGVTSMGLRFAQWADALAEGGRRLQAAAQTACPVSLGGATGNLAAWGNAGPALRAELARELGLHDPGATWHTLRAPWLALACDAALAAGTMGKIAHDVALGTMAEVGELIEPQAPGRGGSTAMPHKRNPVLSMRVAAAVQPLPGLVSGLLAGMRQEHERALGGWQAELGQVPELFTRTLAAAGLVAELLAGLQVDARRCRANIEALQGTVFSEAVSALLIPALGRTGAQTLVTTLCRQALEQGRHLRDLLRGASDPHLSALSPAQLDSVFDVDRPASAAAALIEALLDRAARAA